MSQLTKELDANFVNFSEQWPVELARNLASLKKTKFFLESYRRITVLQAIKVYLIEPIFSKGSAAFFYEAHNDALVSHINASIGSWRSALQALRSCIENVLCSSYYVDHPVELELWVRGEHKLTFSELVKYFERHPSLSTVDKSMTGLEILRVEYALLSKAVHGSAVNFRMTDPLSKVLLWNDDKTKASMWATREKKLSKRSLFFWLR